VVTERKNTGNDILSKRLLKMKHFTKYLLVWISQNLSIPFWMVGHVHLSTNVYADIHEILMSCGMNIIVAIGFIIEYKNSIIK